MSGVLNPRARRVVLLLATLSAAGTIASLLYGQKLHGITPTMSDSYGGGPVGHRAFAETLQRLGYRVYQNRGARFDADSPILFLEPKELGRAGGFDRRFDEALRAREEARRPTLVVLPKWLLVPSAVGPDGEVRPRVVLDPAGAATIANAALPGASIKATTSTGPQRASGVLGEYELDLPRLQVFTSLGAFDEVLLEGPEGAIVVRSSAGTLVLSDPDVLHSFNLHRADHAALALALLERGFVAPAPGADTLVFDEVFHGHGMTYSLGEAMGEFPAVLLVVHLVLLLLALLAAGSLRFGPPRKARAQQRGPAESIAVSATVLADGHRTGAMVLEYVVEVILHAGSELGVAHQNVDEAAAALDESAKRRGQVARAQTILSAARARAGETALSAELRSLAEAIHAFRAALIERRRPESPKPPSSSAAA